jgi:predicted transcriptional regulator
VRLVSLLIKENINLDNLRYKKDKLNNIVATYLQKNTIQEKQKPELIQGIINKLPK